MKNNFRLYIFLILLMTLGLGLFKIDVLSLSYDEVYSIHAAQSGLGKILSGMADVNHPPLIHLVYYYWYKLFGTSELSIRLLPLISGVLAVLFIYLFASLLFDQKTGLLSALFSSSSPFFLYYFREGRGYSLFLLFSIMSLYFFVKALKEDKLVYWIFFVFSSVLGLYTHYYMGLLILSENIFYFIFHKDWSRLKGVALSNIAILVLFAFWLPSFYRQFIPSFQELSRDLLPIPFGLPGKILYIFYCFAVGQTLLPWNFKIVIFAVLFHMPLFFFGLYLLFKEKRHELALLLCYLLGPFILVALTVNQFDARFFIFIGPAYYLIIAFSVMKIPYVSLRYSAIVGLVMISLISINNMYTKKDFHIIGYAEPWREVSQYVKKKFKAGDTIFISTTSKSFEHYWGKDFPGYFVIKDYPLSVLSNMLKKNKRAWYIQTSTKYSEQDNLFYNLYQKRFVDIEVERYLKDEQAAMKRRFIAKPFLDYRIEVSLGRE